ncbi:ELMOD1 [Cordylochernes scorpioides]|uniref:ELMOD1 n=1 Tax=Cordylochernes scorpioides TaxID=51811 RepID=A0ABY6KB12_9ARAC|nr:ELMOD1 [Cordylochernes scorpioides]
MCVCPGMIIALIASAYDLIYWYLRPFIKWFLRKTTKLCELQRICYGDPHGALRTSNVGRLTVVNPRDLQTSLSPARQNELKTVLGNLGVLADSGRFTEDYAARPLAFSIKRILEVKQINPDIHREFVPSINTCLLQIYGYKQLVYSVEQLRKTAYSAANMAHEKKLMELWDCLMPLTPLESRISKNWTEIGFQGDDPQTDFRGMGCLGLDNLLYFASQHTQAAQHVLSHSRHPKYGYSFAIVGINLTSMAYHFLVQGKLKFHLYNFVNGCPTVDDFHHIYCYFFFEFDKFWLSEKPQDIMEFSRIRAKFEERMSSLLSRTGAVLNFNMAIETL